MKKMKTGKPWVLFLVTLLVVALMPLPVLAEGDQETIEVTESEPAEPADGGAEAETGEEAEDGEPVREPEAAPETDPVDPESELGNETDETEAEEPETKEEPPAAGEAKHESLAGEAALVEQMEIMVNGPTCGEVLDPADEECRPDPFVVVILGDEWLYDATETGFAAWVASYDEESYEPYAEPVKVVGGETYLAYFSIIPAEGYVFAEDVEIQSDEEETEIGAISVEPGKIVVAMSAIAKHDVDYDTMEHGDANCVTPGYDKYTCLGCGEEFYEENGIDPDEHEWGEWTVDGEPTVLETASKTRRCQLCQKEQTKTVPRLYAKVYEPETSWPMAATVAWRADSSIFDVAGAEVRPQVAFVTVDAGLRVLDADGGVLADDIEQYVRETAPTVIPAFCIRDGAAAEALKNWLAESGFEDCFVVSTPENKALVKDVADLLHVRGMLDYSDMTAPSRKDLTDMVAAVNGAHGKIVLLSAEAATRENVKLLQSLAATVWVEAPADQRTLLTLYTSGVQGVLVDDYEAAFRAEEFFADDAPSVLRVPLIIGHRGDPSNYPENTLDSAQGAFDEGADAIENDIQLSTDGEIFIRHDGNLYRFYGSNAEVEKMSLAEIRALKPDWENEDYGVPVTNEVPSRHAKYGKLFGGKLYGEEEQNAFVTPTFREYLETFKGKNVIHDTEIKTSKTEIIPAFKELVDAYDAWDQVFTITFVQEIMEEIYTNYPEIAIGNLESMVPDEEDKEFYDWTSMEEALGAEATLEQLMSVMDRYNTTMNPDAFGIPAGAVKAARHRGLTVWPWTYDIRNEEYEARFAADYVKGYSGLTADEAWIASAYIEEIDAEDQTVKSEEDLIKPAGTAKNGEEETLTGAEAVFIEDLNEAGTEKLMVWRYPANLDVDGKSYGTYYLYSNPFVMSLEEEEPEEEKVTYSCTEGEGGQWTKGSSETLNFVFSRSTDDDAAFSHFTGLQVDGATLDAAHYTAESGSVIVKLAPGYLEGLTTGEHSLTAGFDDGDSVTVSFSVAAAETEPEEGQEEEPADGPTDDPEEEPADEPTDDQEEKPSDKPDEKPADEAKDKPADGSQTPPTGDPENPALWIGLLAAALTGLGIAGGKRFIRRRS